ncbi:protein kinase domain protein [Aspergillus arachidicola]|uniref:non-specific serine/threonine protein kinase n=1 Tax=Aspergillus arachidicola TaxID=656916 RepID=A0A2G7FN58_9EURO|nr:protein kinase domain protein [Aspergillus arachidicola]
MIPTFRLYKPASPSFNSTSKANARVGSEQVTHLFVAMYLKRIIQSVPCKPLPIPAKLLPTADLVEEEHTPHYEPRHFYPVRLYEILNNRYQIAAKIGWGTSSTVWLARDLHQWRWLPPRYVAIKVNASNYTSQESAEKELRITEHITKANPQHPGRDFVATLLDSFRVVSPGGTHICMVFDALCEPLWMLKRRFEGNTIPLDVLKPVSKFILEGLRYLHTECHIIHTDLKSDNILLALRNPSVLDSVAQDEMNNPSPRKQLDDRDIYLSRNYWKLSPDELGRSIITDFGLAVRGDGPPNSHPIQPEGYRAPEVCLGDDWGYSVDIWNLGVMLWDLFYGHGPFDTPLNSRGSGSADEAHLGQIISLLGPLHLISSAGEKKHLGKFKFPELIGQKDLVSMAKEIDDDDGMPQFVDFISRMLRWRPEDRTTPDDLLSHPWLP